MASQKCLFNIIFAIVFALCLTFVCGNPIVETGEGSLNNGPSPRRGRFYGLGYGGGMGYGGYPYGGGYGGMGGSSASASASASSMGFGK